MPEEGITHSMPKYQPCSKCRKNCKLIQKTMGGGDYYCSNCDEKFFVQHPVFKSRRK